MKRRSFFSRLWVVFAAAFGIAQAKATPSPVTPEFWPTTPGDQEIFLKSRPELTANGPIMRWTLESNNPFPDSTPHLDANGNVSWVKDVTDFRNCRAEFDRVVDSPVMSKINQFVRKEIESRRALVG